jgi:hypothetical protein
MIAYELALQYGWAIVLAGSGLLAVVLLLGGRRRKRIAAPLSLDRAAALAPDERKRLELLLGELADCLVALDGSVLLDDAVEVNTPTMPGPALEIAYPDHTVLLTPSIDYFDPEEV